MGAALSYIPGDQETDDRGKTTPIGTPCSVFKHIEHGVSMGQSLDSPG